MMLGLALVIGSACVFNNYYDRDIDKKMLRTSTRGIASGKISGRSALLYAAILGVLGMYILYFYTTEFAYAAALAGFVVYVFAYTPLKHKTPYALFVGAIAGATPPVVGYAAATGTINTAALWLFIFLFLWQLPHFLGIAAYRYEEYAAAGVPLFINKPTEHGKKIGRVVFYLSLVVLLAWCGVLMLHR